MGDRADPDARDAPVGERFAGHEKGTRMTVSPTPLHAPPHVPRRLLVAGMALLALVGIGAALVLGSVFDSSSGSEPVLGSAVTATETRAVPSFTSVELAGANSVTIQIDDTQSVVVQADDNLLANVTTKVEDGRLVIATTGSFTAMTPMSVALTVPSLEGLVLSGTGSAAADGIRASALEVSLSGSGLVRVTGTADRLDVALGGSGDLELGGLEARDAGVVLSGSGRIVVHASGTLDASIPGTGSIVYSGSPAVTRSITGTGTISGS
jgi:hypothetical protein